MKKIVKFQGTPVKTHPLTGQPVVPYGIHKVRRGKIGNPAAWHFGLLANLNGFPVAVDLQQDVGPRRISPDELAAGKTLYIMQSLTSPTEINAARARLDDALANMSVWRFFDNNCEHFIQYIVTGEKKSDQINGLKWAAGLAIAAWLFG
jgi:hypothetical protein